MTAQYDPKAVAELLALDEKRTPGEWVSRDHAENIGSVHVKDRGTVASVSLWRDGIRGDADENLANCIFIAAAPRLAAQLRAASSEIDALKHDIERHVQICADQAEQVEKERASRLLADDTLLKAQNNALKFMYRVKELERALEQAAQIAEQTPYRRDIGMMIAAKIRALTSDEAG